MFDALREPLVRSDAERRLPWDERLEAHVIPPTKRNRREERLFAALQRCPLAEGISRVLTSTWGDPEDDPQSPHSELCSPELMWLARSNPERPLEEPAVVHIPKPEVRFALGGVDALLVTDADAWDALQGDRAYIELVRIVDYGLAQLSYTVGKGIRRRKRRLIDPWGIVTRWGVGSLPDTRVLVREAKDGEQMELALAGREDHR